MWGKTLRRYANLRLCITQWSSLAYYVWSPKFHPEYHKQARRRAERGSRYGKGEKTEESGGQRSGDDRPK